MRASSSFFDGRSAVFTTGVGAGLGSVDDKSGEPDDDARADVASDCLALGGGERS